MKLENVKLRDPDIGKAVKYMPTYTRGNPQHKDCRPAVITGFNTSCIFIKIFEGEKLGDKIHAVYSKNLTWKTEN